MIDILAVGAHPDDVDFGCGGILAKMSAKGKKVVIVDLTHGDKGTHGTKKERIKEGVKAADSIGAQRFNLDFKDCQIGDTYENRLKIVKIIRKFKPRLILAPYWQEDFTHPDHTATGLLTRYALRYSLYGRILPELPIHHADGILYYLSSAPRNPDFLVDITDYAGAWQKMMLCHKSQMQTFDYADWNMRIASRLGVMIDRPFAQGLLKGAPVVVDNIMNIAQGAREI